MQCVPLPLSPHVRLFNVVFLSLSVIHFAISIHFLLCVLPPFPKIYVMSSCLTETIFPIVLFYAVMSESKNVINVCYICEGVSEVKRKNETI